MPAYLDTFNWFVALGAIVLQVASVVLVLAMIFSKNRTNPIRLFFKKYAFILGFIVSLGGMSLSLFYSNVIGFPPCELCYVARIFMYPQVFLFAMELYKRDRTLVDFSILLALLNTLVEIYHVYIEHGGESALPCASPTAVSQVSCVTRYVYEFGYVTIPLMALSAAFFILIVMVNYKYMSRA